MIARTAAAALSLLLFVGACASDEAYPSLAPRAIEKVSLDEPEPAPAAPSTASADPATAARLAEIVARVEKAAAEFDAEAARARTAVSAGGARIVGGEAWVAAQLAVTRLDAARGGLSGALAELDGLRLEQVQAGASDPAVEAAWERVNTLSAKQDADYAALVAQLPSD